MKRLFKSSVPVCEKGDVFQRIAREGDYGLPCSPIQVSLSSCIAKFQARSLIISIFGSLDNFLIRVFGLEPDLDRQALEGFKQRMRFSMVESIAKDADSLSPVTRSCARASLGLEEFDDPDMFIDTLREVVDGGEEITALFAELLMDDIRTLMAILDHYNYLSGKNPYFGRYPSEDEILDALKSTDNLPFVAQVAHDELVLIAKVSPYEGVREKAGVLLAALMFVRRVSE